MTSSGHSNGNLTLLMTSNGQQWEFNTANDMLVVTQWQFYISSDS